MTMFIRSDFLLSDISLYSGKSHLHNVSIIKIISEGLSIEFKISRGSDFIMNSPFSPDAL
jgi:hypothetical protein